MVQDEPPGRGPGRSDTQQPAAWIALKVVPGSRKSQVVGPYGDRLKIKVAAPPEDGRANKEVCSLIAEACGVPVKNVTVLSGAASPEKVVRVAGLTAALVASALKLDG